MQPSASWLLGWLAAAGVQTPDVPAAPVAPVPPRLEEFRAASVEVAGFDEAAVLAALQLRLPRLEVEPHGGPSPTVTPHVYLRIARDADATGHVQVITSDGRAYARSFTIEVGQEVRVAASTAASLLFSIEQGAVAPVEENVTIPGADVPAPTDPTPTPEPAPSVREPEPPPKQEPPLRPPPLRPLPGWELASGLHGLALLGVGPTTHGSAFVGGGGGLTLELRAPRGGLLALDVRGLGRATAAFAVGRLRIGLAGGYAYRRGRFELPVVLAATIEPWWTSAPVHDGTGVTTRPPLIGGLLRVTPALRVRVPRGPLAAIRVGPRFELAGSFAIDGGATEIGLGDVTGASKVRLGGLELALGLEVALQWSLPRAQRD